MEQASVSWWGKLLGGATGYFLGSSVADLAGGTLGTLLGVALGHQIDRRFGRRRGDPPLQSAFFFATFSVMGRLAKADGRVSEDEIHFARSVMEHMSLNEAQRRIAIRVFTEGKAASFPLDATLDRLRAECRRNNALVQMFLEIQLQAAYCDGELKAEEKRLLLRIFRQLGFTARDFDRLDTLVRAARAASGKSEGNRWQQHATAPAGPDRVGAAYRVLGIEPEASESEIKKAYRRMMNQHHPDKLIAKGLPEEMMRTATEKVQEIKSAYEMIKAIREMR